MMRCLAWIRDRLIFCGLALAGCSLTTDQARWYCFSGYDSCGVAVDECFVRQRHCRVFARRSTGLTGKTCAIERQAYCFRDATDASIHCTAERSHCLRAKLHLRSGECTDVRPYDDLVGEKLFVPGMCVQGPGGVIKMITRIEDGNYVTVDWHEFGWSHFGMATPSELREQEYATIECPATH